MYKELEQRSERQANLSAMAADKVMQRAVMVSQHLESTARDLPLCVKQAVVGPKTDASLQKLMRQPCPNGQSCVFVMLDFACLCRHADACGCDLQGNGRKRKVQPSEVGQGQDGKTAFRWKQVRQK